jgi:NADPH:quinone reductase-like Zn-dependent oxidoreductase
MIAKVRAELVGVTRRSVNMKRQPCRRPSHNTEEIHPMHAIVTHSYGGPEVLRFESRPDPVAGPGQVLVRVTAAGVNPIDFKRRSGAVREYFPIQFPGVLGYDLSGTVAAIGAGVSGFSVGDAVFGVADQTYAELCVVSVAALARIPAGLDPVDAAAVPLVALTGSQLAEGTSVSAGQTVIVTGALGGVGRAAVYTAKMRGATVIAAVRGSQVAAAKEIGADRVVATDDPAAVNALPIVDAVADAVGGPTANALIAKVKAGGVFASVLGVPAAAKDHSSVRATDIQFHPDALALASLGQAVRDGKLRLPPVRRFAMRDAALAHAAAESAGAGKIVLVV